MSTTEKRMTLAFTKQQLRELDDLIGLMGESPSAIIHRAVTLLHYDTFKDKGRHHELSQQIRGKDEK